MAREPDPKRLRPKVYEETLQVRVRGKNPLIERKKSGHRADSHTAGGELAPPPAPSAQVQAEAPAEPSEQQASIYESLENTDRTEELEVAGQELLEALTDRPSSPTPAQLYIEEEETVLASEAPKAAGRWLEEGAQEIRLRRGEAKNAKSAPPRGSAQVAVVPRGRLVGSGTDAASAEVHRQMIDLKEKALPNVDSPALRMVRSELNQAQLTVLDRVLKGELDKKGIDPSLSPKRAMEHLIHDRAYAELPAREQAAVLRALVPDPRDVTTAKAAIALLKTGVLKRLRVIDRERLWSIFEVIGPDLRARLAQVAARQIRGKSVLEDRDPSDVGLLEHLAAMVEPNDYPRALEERGLRPRKVLALLIGTLAQPERLSFEDGSAGVVGMLEFALADASPAELVRIWRGLTSKEMTVELAGKVQVNLQTRLQQEPNLEMGGRNTPVRVAFESLPDLARSGGRARRPTFIMPGGHGIDADVLSRTLSLIYGVGFTVAAGTSNALRHLERVNQERGRVPPVFLSILSDRGERLFIFDRLEEAGAQLRAPHGKSSKRAGAVRLDPRREVVDPDRGLERITRADLEAGIGVGLIPRL
ncbi:MAG: hypothetical protein IPG45_23110 [Deltaproteobacteria bacterium]|nr:hypothetical protein [Deltaproteobacteria bacterium]